MLRPILAIAGLLAAAAPAFAANYSATLSVPTNARLVASDIVWSCGAAACQGATDESRPLVLCQSLAKRAGKVDSFFADGRAFTPAELDRCNAFAKAAPGRGLAAN
jgi:hypothetical protein